MFKEEFHLWLHYQFGVVSLLQDSVYSYILKAFISTSTIVLLVLIVMYHAREIQVSHSKFIPLIEILRREPLEF